MKYRFRAAVVAVALVGMALPVIAAEFGLEAEVRTGLPVTHALIESSGTDVENSERLTTQRAALVQAASERGVLLDHARVSGAIIDDPALPGASVYLTWTEPMRPIGVTRARIEGAAQSGDGLSIQFDVTVESGPVCAIVEFEAAYAEGGFHRLWHCSEHRTHGTRIGATAAAILEPYDGGQASIRVDEFKLSSVPDADTAGSVSIDQRWVTPGLADAGANPERLSQCEEHRPGTMQLDLEFPHTPSPHDVFMTVPNGWCGNAAVRQHEHVGWTAEFADPVWDPRPSWNGVGAVYNLVGSVPEALILTESTTVLISECGLPGGFGCSTETGAALAWPRQ